MGIENFSDSDLRIVDEFKILTKSIKPLGISNSDSYLDLCLISIDLIFDFSQFFLSILGKFFKQISANFLSMALSIKRCL